MRLKAKWAAAARVLADTPAAGAASLDLRIPERPSAAYGAGDTAADTATPQESQVQAAATAAVAQPEQVTTAAPAAGATGATGAAGAAPVP